jgi:transposase
MLGQAEELVMAIKRVQDLLELVGSWEGFEVGRVTTEDDLQPDVHGVPAPRLVIELRAKPETARRCSRCGEIVVEVHDTTTRRIRDLPLGEWDTWLVVPTARLRCPRCGPTVEAIPWLDRYQRMTKRLAERIARLAQVTSLQATATWFRVSWDTVKQIDQRALAARLGPIDAHWDALRVLAVDEFALHRGHRYATVVIDPTCKRVLWIARGREANALTEFFQQLGPERCARIEAVTLDMWAPYTQAVRAQCPRAALVYDLFHVVAKYGREVIDRVRVDETNRIARANGPNDTRTRAARRVIKGARWLLLRNRTNLRTRAERLRLRELLDANRALFIVYVLKDDLKHLWDYRYPAAARRFWREWRRRALASRIPALRQFVAILDRHLDGILSHCRYRLHTGILEGINNKIKVLKRIAYGFRDEAYFFLKIRAAFPGIP